MTTSEAKASKINDKLKEAGYSTFDPMTIAAIIMAIIKLLQGCNLGNKAAARRINECSALDRHIIRKQVRQHYMGDEGDALSAALIDEAPHLTTTEVTKMYQESGS